jgi:acetyl-CoA carboxylase biotin carboxyl carrier protein
MGLTHDDVKKIMETIDGAEHLEEVQLVYGDLQLHVWRGGGEGGRAAPAPSSVAVAGMKNRVTASPRAADVVESAEYTQSGNEVVIRAPMLGTFYRAASPGDKPFVEVGQKVDANDTVCVIEVMKLFNSIPAGVVGTVTKILAENAKLVEFNQALLVITPTAVAKG